MYWRTLDVAVHWLKSRKFRERLGVLPQRLISLVIGYINQYSTRL